MRLVTTHADCNPLIKALKDLGVDVLTRRSQEEVLDGTSWQHCDAYYGNLFDDIKKPLQLMRLKSRLRKAQVPYVFWNRDAPWHVGIKPHRAWLLQYLKPVDIYLAHSEQNADWFSENLPVYFPNAASEHYYRSTDLDALRDEAAYKTDLLFIGSVRNAKDRNCRERGAFLKQLEFRLTQSKPDLRILVVDTTQESLSIDRQLELIRISKLSLSTGAMCDLEGNASYGLPERVFGIPAAGGLVITDNRQSLDKTFPEGECPSFTSLDDCVDLILNLLGDFEEIRRQAEILHRVVCQNHTYKARAQEFIKLVENYRTYRN